MLYLGITLDEELNYSHHLTSAKQKITRAFEKWGNFVTLCRKQLFQKLAIPPFTVT